MSSEIKVKSLYKAIKLLDYFNAESPERGVSEVANLADLPKSTVHNIFSTFEACGLLVCDEITSKYRLGLKIIELSNGHSMANDIRNTVHPFLEEICAFTGENVYFATSYDDEVLYIDAVFSSKTMQRSTVIGARAPLYCTGVGKAILSKLSDKKIDKIYENGVKKFTDNTILSAIELKKEMAIIRENIYIVDNMEHEFGVKCVAVPIVGMNGKLIGAISTTGPSLRFSDDKVVEYGKKLIDIANRLRIYL